MATTKKIIVTSKKNLITKYGKNFAAVEKLLASLKAADSKNKLDTQIVFIDDTMSAKKAGIKAVASITRQSCKKAIDEIYKKLPPAYLVIFGSGDVFPFQEITNPVPYNPEQDDDHIVPSDLPYACDTAYSTDMSSFTGPSRVIGRIPDIQGIADINYLKTVINTIISFKQQKAAKYLNYFAVTAEVWTKSTRQSLSSVFGFRFTTFNPFL
jgi:Peptidase family C25